MIHTDVKAGLSFVTPEHHSRSKEYVERNLPSFDEKALEIEMQHTSKHRRLGTNGGCQGASLKPCAEALSKNDKKFFAVRGYNPALKWGYK